MLKATGCAGGFFTYHSSCLQISHHPATIEFLHDPMGVNPLWLTTTKARDDY